MTRHRVLNLKAPDDAHGQIVDMHQRQMVLLPQPAEELQAPSLTGMGGEPNPLPVSLILTADLNGLAHRLLELIDGISELVVGARCLIFKTGDQLSVDQQI